MIGSPGSRFSNKSHRFLIFDRLDRVKLETQLVHPIFIDLLVDIVSSIGIGKVTFKVELTLPNHTRLG